MSPPCDGCGGPRDDDGPCLTCRTIAATKQGPSGLSNQSPASTNGNGAPLANALANPEPMPDLGELLDELAGFVRRFVVMSEAQVDTAAVWIVHSHCFDSAEQTPYLAISSAEKRSGKTRLLEVLELLVARPWLTGRVTAAVLARKVDGERPTLLLDESDAAFKGDKDYAEALRGLLNTGHRRGGKSTVCVGQGAEIGYKDFSTYCPKAIAGIGKLPDTVADRSLPIRLERRAPGETAERFRRRDVELDALVLTSALDRIAELGPMLADARPELPAELDDRAQDAVEPLLAIADLAEGEWPDRIRRAVVELHAGRELDDESAGVRLLADVRAMFDARDVDRLASTVMLDALHRLDEAPWGDWYGKPLSARKLAQMLRPYGVQPRTVRFDDATARGFLREQFEEAWDRYIPVSPPSIRHSDTNGTGSGIEPDSYPTQEPECVGLKTAANPHGERDVLDVSDREPDIGAGACSCLHPTPLLDGSCERCHGTVSGGAV